MGVPGPGLHRGFMQLGVSAFTIHTQLIPPLPPTPAPIPGLIEIPGFMQSLVPPYAAKAGTTVFFDGGPAVQEGHDMGFLIPHFAIPMNVLCGVNTVLSKHKILVPIGKVKIQGTNMGSSIMFFPGQICADPVSIPTAVVMLLKCTVWSTVTFADFIAAVITSVIDAAFDFVWSKMTGGIPGLDHAGQRLVIVFLSELGKAASMKFVKDVVWEGFYLGGGHPFLDYVGLPTRPELENMIRPDNSPLPPEVGKAEVEEAIHDAVRGWIE